MKKTNQSATNPKQKIEHLKKTKPWVYCTSPVKTDNRKKNPPMVE